MKETPLALTSIGSYVVSLGEINEMLQAFALIISSLAGLLAVLKHFRQYTRGEKERSNNSVNKDETPWQ